MNYTIKPFHAAEDPFEATRPIGFCVDIGSPRSVIGKRELSRLLHHLGRLEKKLKSSINSFCFADKIFESLSAIVQLLESPHHLGTILVEMDVVGANDLALRGLGAIKERSLTPCIVTNMLVKRVVKRGKSMDLWSIKVTRARSKHLFAP